MKRIILELWEIQGVLYISLALQLTGFWHWVIGIYGVSNIIFGLIMQAKYRFKDVE